MRNAHNESTLFPREQSVCALRPNTQRKDRVFLLIVCQRKHISQLLLLYPQSLISLYAS